MKWLFILLVIANLSYYFWPTEAPVDGDATLQQTTRPAIDAPTILLIEEAQQRQLYPVAEPVASKTPAADITPRDQPPGQQQTDTSATAPNAASAPAGQPAHVATAAPDTTSDQPAPPPPADDTKQPPAAVRKAAAAPKPAAAEATASAASTTPATDTDTGAEACFRLGPFKSLAAAAIAKKYAVDLGFGGRLLQATGKATASYLIYLGPFEDPDKRIQTMDDLFDAGVGDILIGKGEHLNSLVTGDFSSRAAAAEKIAELEKLGYKPQLAKENRRRTRFYLDLSSPDGSGSRTSADTLQQNFPDTGLKSTKCKTRSRR